MTGSVAIFSAQGDCGDHAITSIGRGALLPLSLSLSRCAVFCFCTELLITPQWTTALKSCRMAQIFYVEKIWKGCQCPNICPNTGTPWKFACGGFYHGTRSGMTSTCTAASTYGESLAKMAKRTRSTCRQELGQQWRFDLSSWAQFLAAEGSGPVCFPGSCLAWRCTNLSCLTSALCELRIMWSIILMFLGMFKFQVCLGRLLGLQSPDAKEGSLGHGKVLSHKRSRVQTISFPQSPVLKAVVKSNRHGERRTSWTDVF